MPFYVWATYGAGEWHTQVNKGLSKGLHVAKYSGADDVYRALVDQSEDHWLLGLLAFAVVEQQRIDWVKHRIENAGVTPSPAEVAKWYEDQPLSTFVRAKAEAETALQNYGAEAVEEFDESYRKEIAQGIVVGEIQKLGKWGPQIVTNIVGGIISSIVFSAVLVIVAFFVLANPSTNDIALKLKQQVEVKDVKVRNNE
jgi:hypothetical protein